MISLTFFMYNLKGNYVFKFGVIFWKKLEFISE